MRRRSLGCSLAGAALLLSPPATDAFAQPAAPLAGATRLVYQRAPGAESCPDEGAFREAVAAQTTNGADPFAASGPSTLRVTFAPVAARGGFQGTMELLDPSGRPAGTDTKQAATCAEAARALAFSAGVVFLATPPSPSPSSTILAPQVSATAAPPSPVLPPPPAATPSPVVRVHLGAGALVGFGFAPNPSAGFGAFVGLRFPGSLPAFGISLEGRADLDASGDVVSLSSAPAQARTGFAGGSLAPCGYLRWFFGCGLVTLGAVHGTAGANYEPAQQGSFFAGLGGRVGAEVWIVDGRPSLGLRLAVDGLFSLSRPAVIAGGERIWISPIGAGAASLHVVTLF